ncbi:Cof-type HAD-IIB family hydrolase [Oceanobacillus jeddahense]|uniref:Cof-type HAD-IIB family hydrolase n=1 Tax=Oceanobacillus jeddahense TaxID=1462527 RepID=A0ABY5JSJ8_9BACI|nr:Cof-type HAD-IIB family hydrolase [Oceanobacillus jeddahense]UUI02755.1 Cof-type HAD-IIB family hydrolase [Oceanobacillus jeddahense]
MKLIASDMDGTLLNENGEISEANAQAVKKAINQGIEFIVATGRSYQAANIPLQAAGITCPVISLNGAVTYQENEKIINSIPMDKQVASRIADECSKLGMYVELFTNKGVFSESRDHFLDVLVDIMRASNPEISDHEMRDIVEQRFQLEEVSFVEHLQTALQDEDIEIYKILTFAFEESQLEDAKKKLRDETGAVITSSGETNLEFNHPKAQKGLAIQKYIENEGWSMEDVMTMGDNWNDASMLEMAGRGVAMGNAADQIKNLCQYETTTNDQNGVAKAIEEMLDELNK